MQCYRKPVSKHGIDHNSQEKDDKEPSTFNLRTYLMTDEDFSGFQELPAHTVQELR